MLLSWNSKSVMRERKIFRLIKSAVADHHCIKMLLQRLQYMSEICLPVTTSAREQHNSGLILISESIDFHKYFSPNG